MTPDVRVADVMAGSAVAQLTLGFAPRRTSAALGLSFP